MNRLRTLTETSILAIAWLLPVAGFASELPATPAERPPRVLFVTGGGTYDVSILTLIDRLPGMEVTRRSSDAAAFSGELVGAFDVVVLYNLSPSLEPRHRARLRAFVEGGGGVVVLHHALASYGDWPWWWQEVTGGRYVLAGDDLPPSRYSPTQSIVASPTGDHPITAPLEGLPIHLLDETYSQLWLSPHIDVLLRTGLASSDGPLLGIGPFSSRRVVVFQPGHGSSAHWNLGFRVLLHRAILWAAGRLEPKVGD